LSLFNTDTNDQTVTFDALVGEGKKYKTNDDAAKAIVEKDNFIERLKAEQEELRRELQTRTPTVDRTQEILDRMEALNKREPVTPTEPHREPERTEYKGLSEADIDRVLSQREAKAKAEANIARVKEKLLETYGEQYGQALKSIAEKNGLSAKDLDDLAARSPQLIFNLIPRNTGERTFVPPGSSIQPDFVPQGGDAKPRSYYEKIKASDRVKYFSAEVQNKMYKDAMTLKEAFEA